MKANARIHAKHGLGNIVGGALRAIPLMGILMWLPRLDRHPPAYNREHACYSSGGDWCRSFNFILDKPHWHKYMPYERLQLHELCVYVDDRMNDVCELKKYEGADLPLVDLNGTLKGLQVSLTVPTVPRVLVTVGYKIWSPYRAQHTNYLPNGFYK